MFYLVRFDFRPGKAKLQDVWRQSAAAMRGSGGASGSVRGFKVVGRQTVFALAEFADNDAADDALARLSDIEGLEGAELEVMPLRLYDEPEAPERAVRAPGEKPAEEPATAEEPPPGPKAPGDELSGAPVLSKPGIPRPRTLPEEDAGSARAPGAPDEEPREGTSGPEGESSGASGPASPGAGRRPGVSITGMIRNLDAERRAPEEPAAGKPASDRGDPAGRRAQREVPGPGTPEDPSVTGMIRGLDSPGRKPAGPKAQGPGASGTEEPGSSPAPPEGPSVTGMIRGLDAPGKPSAKPSSTPEEPARSGDEDAPTQRRSRSPNEARREAGAAAGPEGPPASITGMIRSLDAPGHVPAGKPAVPGPRLLLRPGDGTEGETLEVNRAGATMGRSLGNSIRIDDGMLSRQHARIEFRDGGFWLSDLGSSNGTFANGNRLRSPHRLQTGDLIELGSTRLNVKVEGEAV